MRKRVVHISLFIITPIVFGGITLLTSYLERGSWWIEMLSFFMPLVLVGIFIVLLAWVIIRPGYPYLVLPVLALISAIEPLNATFAMNGEREVTGEEFSVMSFNAALFNPYRPTTLESEPRIFDSFYDHLRAGGSPDVLCIQEFFHSARDGREMTADSIRILGGYSYFYINPVHNKKYDGLIGVITFSKYPIVANGKLTFGDERFNNGHWNDIVIGEDTVRVFNIQLRSMSIRWQRDGERGAFRQMAWNLRNIYRKLKWGYRARQEEMDYIEQALNESPHRKIICADLNALPYSHTYQRLKDRYHNAFERRGRGFGFTYHHFPWFIRIDNQFYDRDLEISYFRTLNEIDISDHYPIEAGYILRR
jgi:exonuclease III